MIINVKGLRFSYSEHDENVLDVPELSVSKGDRVFIQGGSGSGKTTLLKLLGGIFVPSEGEIAILGKAIHALSSRKRDAFRAQHIGFIFQQFNLIPYLSAIDNVNLAHYFSRARESLVAAELLERLNLSEADQKRPSCELSVGQQQRVAIARALINKPDLLLADEPSSSLDERNRDSFMELLMSFADELGLTILFVSHDTSLKRYFNRSSSMDELNRSSEG